MKIKQEYIWLDGSEPQQLRSKTKIVNESIGLDNNPEHYSMWSFDGSSTLQARSGKGENTDCLLKPVFVVNDPFRGHTHKLVLCEVLNPDGSKIPNFFRVITSSFFCEPVVTNQTNTTQKAIRYRYVDGNSNLIFLTLSPSSSPTA